MNHEAEHRFAISRRRLMAASLGLAAAAAAPRWADALPGSLDAEALGVRPGAADQSRALARALERSAREQRPLALGPGVYRVVNVAMPDGATLVGAPDATRLELAGVGPILVAKGAKRIAIRGVSLDGSSIPPGGPAGVLDATDVLALLLDEVAVDNAGGTAVSLARSGAIIRQSRIQNARDSAISSIDGKGVVVADCLIRSCRNNAVVIRRSVKGDEASIVSRNRIEDTGAIDGGLGWNGNGVNVSMASGVVVSDNAIRRSAFTAVRAHKADDVMIANNLCVDCGETGIFSEFAFTGAVISNNIVDGAATGIAVANFNEGGRLSTVSGNVVRNVFRRKLLDQPGEGYGWGIGVEADTAVTGNVVENAATLGISVGWGPYLRDVAVTGNVVRGCETGIGVSVVEGVGPATIVGNTVTNFRKGGVVGFRWSEPATPDLAVGGSGGLPGLTVAQNTLR